MLPFPSRQILPCEQIPISSVIAQNPPALLPPRSVYPLPICPSCRCRSQPLPGDSRKQRYNTLDFPTENRVPRKALPSFGNLPPRGTLFPSGHPTCPYSGYPSCSYTMDVLLSGQVKQAQRFAHVVGRFLCLFLFSSGWAKHTRKPCSPSVLVEDFRIGVRKPIVPSPYIWYNKTVELSDRRYPYGHFLQ